MKKMICKNCRWFEENLIEEDEVGLCTYMHDEERDINDCCDDFEEW